MPSITSFFAEDNNSRLLANNLDLLYGLTGDDNLSVSPDFTLNDVAILVGGLGNDQYIVPPNSTVVIADNGLGSDTDTIFASGLSGNSSFFTIDNRHLYVFDEVTDTYLLILDYEAPENQIEFIEQGDGRLTFDEYTAAVDAALANNPASNITFDELQNGADVPERAQLDLSVAGLSPSTINEDIVEIGETAIELETSIVTAEVSTTGNGTDGSLSEEDSSYSFNGGEYFYDFYSLNPNIYDSGDIANISLISNDFSPALFVLDSRGNVLDFAFDDDDDGNSAIAFQVGTGEPIFIAVESATAGAVGDYNILFEESNLNLAPEARETTTLDEQAIIPYDRTRTGETLTGTLTTTDAAANVNGQIFYQDDILLSPRNVSAGDEIRVSLTSDFDGILAVESLDDNSNLELSVFVDEAGADGTETATFTLDVGTTYTIMVDSVSPEATGNYTVTTEVIASNSTPEETLPLPEPPEEDETIITPDDINETIPGEDLTDSNNIPDELAIQTTDSLTGNIAIDDELIETAEGIFYTDILFFEGDNVGEVEVNLESDFDAVLLLATVDNNGNLIDSEVIDGLGAGGIEQGIFTFEPDANSFLSVTSFEPENTGSYVITTEFLG
ncbi:MAG: hypothetical protein AAFQ41_03830 [Cyanobacteria bacterium J06623_7]